MTVHLETLGGLRVIQNGEERAELPRQRLRCALVVYVALERRVARASLLELLWPDVEPRRARRTLNQMVYELRQHLGPDWLETSGQIVSVTDQVTADATRFADLVAHGDPDEAAALYRGPFLGSIRLADTPGFERWADDRRTRLAALYRDLQAGRIERMVAGGHAGAALAAARRWVGADPIDDDAQRTLIGLLARAGLRNEALRQFADYEKRLAWIDALPLPDTAALVEDLRQGRVEVEVPPEVGAGPAAALEAQTGVVVLPMVNLSDDATHQYFCDGLVEEIIHTLGRMPTLRIVPRTSAVAYARAAPSIGHLVQQLGVTHALEGSVRFAGDRFRVRVSLVRGRPEEELWEDQFEGRLATTDVFELQDRVAAAAIEALAHEIRPPPSPEAPPPRRPGRSPLPDPEAHALYLRGRHAWLGRTIPDLDRALGFFQEAAVRDPGYARAYAGIADVYAVLGGVDYAIHPPTQIYPKLKAAAEKALELNPDLAEAHAALGNYLLHHAWDWDAAGRHFREAIALDHRYSTARQWYSNYLMYQGQEDEAIAEASLALEFDPGSVFLYSTLARHFQLMRSPEQATHHYRRALELDPAFPSARLGLALADLQRGHSEECLSSLQRLAEGSEREIPLLVALQAYALGVTRQGSSARRALQRLKATRAPYLPPEYVALAYLGLDEHDRALDWLEKAVEVRSQSLPVLGKEPLFDPLRGHPRFARLLEAVGL